MLGVLKDIGAGDHAMLTVYNKSDLLEDPAPASGAQRFLPPRARGLAGTCWMRFLANVNTARVLGS